MTFRFTALAFVLAAAPGVIADSTISPANPYSFSANVGWLNNKHDQPSAPAGLVVSEYTVQGYAYGANIGWIRFGVSSPANGVRYSNAAGDTGVNHNGTGDLSGYAYGANVGWISFNASPSSPDRPRVNLANGTFAGYAYGANIGWVNLAMLATSTISAPDTDADGIADAWEIEHFSNLTTAKATSDSDGDGATDLTEYTAMSDPSDATKFFKITSQTLDAGMAKMTLVFTTNGARLYRLQWSPDLAVWVNDASGIQKPDAGPTTTKFITFPAGSQRFFRVIAIKPLQN